MFVSDLLKNARPEEDAPSVQSKGSSIYDRIREEQRRIENEWFIVENKKKELEALRSTAHAPCKRHELRAQTEIKRKCEELQSDIAEIESGSRLRDFNLKASSYIHEYQKQQFCTLADDTPPARLGGPCEQSNAVMDEFAVNVEGGVPKFDIQCHDVCPICKEAMQLYQAFAVLICPFCGRCKDFLDATASLLSYSDDYDYCSFSYKRINHFSEWLSSIQAKENLEIPQCVLDTIMQHMHDLRITDSKDVTVHKVREILKKLKLRRYYEHVQLITCKITGRAPPRMTPEMEARIKTCFLAASSSFGRHCPPDRKNMISYQLVLLKLCELLNYTDFIPYFMLLKGRDKLSRMDTIWKLICTDLDWTYIPSVA